MKSREKFIIYLGADHAGFALKEKIKKYFDKKGIKHKDFGAFEFNKNDDYPDFVIPVAKKVALNKNSLGIVFGGSGQGEAIAANKVRGIRAAVFYGGNKKIIKLSKEHNNANILSLASWFLKEKEAIRAVDSWLRTKFSGEKRHRRRLEKIDNFENQGQV